MMSLSQRELTKWPRLLVVGDPVTPEQANEILVRTDSWLLCKNDRFFERLVGGKGSNAIAEFRVSVGALDLNYLGNSRMVSAWVGGPHGWCDWDGRIGSTNYNIGKWPCVADVDEDWVLIAEAFPFLSLRAQLRPEEGEEAAVVEWVVKDGTALLQEPTVPILPEEPVFNAALCASPGRARGVSLDRLGAAVDQVRKARL